MVRLPLCVLDESVLQSPTRLRNRVERHVGPGDQLLFPDIAVLETVKGARWSEHLGAALRALMPFRDRVVVGSRCVKRCSSIVRSHEADSAA